MRRGIFDLKTATGNNSRTVYRYVHRSRPGNLHRTIFLGAILAVIGFIGIGLTGCGSVPKLPQNPFSPKKTEPPAYPSVSGPIERAEFSAEGDFLAVLYQPGPVVNEGRAPLSANQKRLALFNTEFETSLFIEESLMAQIESPCSFAFESNHSLLTAARTGPGEMNLFRIPLSEENLSVPIVKEEEKTPVLTPVFEKPLPYQEGLLSPKGEWLAGQKGDGSWEIIDTKEPKRAVVFPNASETPDHLTVVRVLEISPDGELVVTLSVGEDRTESSEKIITVWDLKVPRSIPLEKARKLPFTAPYITSFTIKEKSLSPLCRFSPDGNMLAFRTKEKYVALYQAANGRLLTEFGEHRLNVETLAFSHSGTKLAIGLNSKYGQTVLWDVRKGTILRSREDTDIVAGQVTAFAFTPDDKEIQCANNAGKLKKWDVRYQTNPQKKE